jgi:proteasome lid subunit RPN8/RPN11
MNILRIARSAYEELRAHGVETYPQECCGVLLGRSGPEGWTVERAVRAENTRIDSPRNRYEIAPAELVKIVREASYRGLEIAGFYHSHPDHAANWSETDLAEAHWLGCSYVIAEVAAGRAAATNAFLLCGELEEDKRFERQTIEVRG